MKNVTLLLLFGLLTPVFSDLQEGGQGAEGQKKRKGSDNLTSRFFQGEAARLDADAQGSWILFDYADPLVALGAGEATGFATFRDGYVTLILAIDGFETRLFQARHHTLLNTGAYRYRFDEMGSLQLSSMMSFNNSSGSVQREPSSQVYEYFAQLDDGLLVLRNAEGMQLSFRKMGPGEFPESAIRKLDGRRANVEQWEIEGEDR